MWSIFTLFRILKNKWFFALASFVFHLEPRTQQQRGSLILSKQVPQQGRLAVLQQTQAQTSRWCQPYPEWSKKVCLCSVSFCKLSEGLQTGCPWLRWLPPLDCGETGTWDHHSQRDLLRHSMGLLCLVCLFSYYLWCNCTLLWKGAQHESEKVFVLLEEWVGRNRANSLSAWGVKRTSRLLTGGSLIQLAMVL